MFATKVCKQLSLCRKSSLAFLTNRPISMACKTNIEDPTSEKQNKLATFAAGCFWGVELAFQRVNGVKRTSVGYTNGNTDNPSYREVCSGTTGHAEAVEVEYDESLVKYTDLLKTFWEIHDPTTLNRQKNDVGTQYRSGIYYHCEQQKSEALASKEEQQKILNQAIVTEIEKAAKFWTAEDYHQQYLEKGGQCADKGCSDPVRCYG